MATTCSDDFELREQLLVRLWQGQPWQRSGWQRVLRHGCRRPVKRLLACFPQPL